MAGIGQMMLESTGPADGSSSALPLNRLRRTQPLPPIEPKKRTTNTNIQNNSSSDNDPTPSTSYTDNTENSTRGAANATNGRTCSRINNNQMNSANNSIGGDSMVSNGSTSRINRLPPVKRCTVAPAEVQPHTEVRSQQHTLASNMVTSTVYDLPDPLPVEPFEAVCPFYNKKGESVVDYKRGKGLCTWIWCYFALFFPISVLIFIPLFLIVPLCDKKSYYDKIHRCPHCNKRIGIRYPDSPKILFQKPK